LVSKSWQGLLHVTKVLSILINTSFAMKIMTKEIYLAYIQENGNNVIEILLTLTVLTITKLDVKVGKKL